MFPEIDLERDRQEEQEGQRPAPGHPPVRAHQHRGPDPDEHGPGQPDDRDQGLGEGRGVEERADPADEPRRRVPVAKARRPVRERVDALDPRLDGQHAQSDEHDGQDEIPVAEEAVAHGAMLRPPVRARTGPMVLSRQPTAAGTSDGRTTRAPSS